MRSGWKSEWGITHKLTPKNQTKMQRKWQPLPIPELPQQKKTHLYANKNNQKSYPHRSRKHRLRQERNTQIEKTNRMLYEKIKKIMQKGSKSLKKVQPQPDPQNEPNKTVFLNTTLKPLSLPHVSTNMSSMRSTQSELSNILDDRGGFSSKYFEELTRARQKQLVTESLGFFECYGWKIQALLLDNGEYVVLKGKKGKKELTKKYLKAKVAQKMQNNLEEWVTSKFQFEI